MAVLRLAPVNIGAAALTVHPIHYLVDTTAELPAASLKLGDTALAKDTNILYKAASASTWTPIDTTTAADTVVRKTSTESVTSSATLQNDNELFYAMTANHTWAFRLVASYSHALATVGLKSSFTGPASSTWSGLMFSHSIATTSFTDGAAPPDTAAVTALGRVAIYDGIVNCGATAGNFQYQWAQSASNGTALVVGINSYLQMKLLV